ncbi:LPD7 domain-containing protein [Vibrio vulnificus]
MLVRVREGKAGIVEYLVDGLKNGRDFTRDELDHRVCIDGNLEVTDLILKHTSKEDKNNYYHITLSFKEKDITTEKITEAYNDYKSLLMSAYHKEEFNCYAEIHFPKIQALKDKRTGEDFERFPHVHMVIPRTNLITNNALTPIGKYTQNEKYFEAMQEKVNYKYNLSSPFDNPRSMQDNPDLISRYKGDNFHGASKELKSNVLDMIHDKNITEWSEFKLELEKFGEVKETNIKDGSYLSVKPDGSKTNIRLRDSCFSNLYISERLYREPRPTEQKVDKTLEDWRCRRSHEIKHIVTASPAFRKQYYSAKPNQQKEMLNKRISDYEERHRESINIRTGGRAHSNKFGFERNRPRSFAEIPICVSSLPVGDLDDRSEQRRNGAQSLLSSDAFVRVDYDEQRQYHTLRRTTARGERGRIDVATQIATNKLDEFDERKQSELQQIQAIKRTLQPRFLFESVKHLSVDPSKYKFFKDKDGFKLKVGKRNLNVSDFLTKHLHLNWNEAKKTLINAYKLQIENRLTKESENCIIFRPVIGLQDHYTVEDSVIVFNYLKRREQLRNENMAALDKIKQLREQANEIAPKFKTLSFRELYESQQQQHQDQQHNRSYAIADLVASKNLKKGEVTYKTALEGKPVFVDRGDRIRFTDKKPSDSTVLAGIQMAAEKFGSVQLKGTPEFIQQVLEQAAKNDIQVVFNPKELHEEFNLIKAELNSKNAIIDGDVMEEKDQNTIVNSSADANKQANENFESYESESQESPVQSESQESPVQPEKITLVSYGSAPYKNIQENKRSYFVELSDGTTHWGIDLNRAVQESGVKIGDEVNVERLAKRLVEIDKDVMDDNGKKIGTEKAEVNRFDWKIEVVTPKEELEQQQTQSATDNVSTEPESAQKPQSESVKSEQSKQEQIPVKDELKEETVFEQQGNQPIAPNDMLEDFGDFEGYDSDYIDHLAAQDELERSAQEKAMFYDEIKARINSAETPEQLESIQAELADEPRLQVESDTYEGRASGETVLDPVIKEMVTNRTNEITQEVQQQQPATKELADGLYRINYVNLDGKLEARINGKSLGDTVTDKFIENLRSQDPFIRNFSVDEIKQGKLDYTRITDGTTARGLFVTQDGLKPEEVKQTNQNEHTQTHRRFIS